MESPFQFGTLATKENFIDRNEDRAMLKQLLTSHINVMLISPRRWGKSSLVKRSMEELTSEKNDIKVCFIDAFSISSEAEFYRTFASKVIECASSKFEKWAEDTVKAVEMVNHQCETESSGGITYDNMIPYAKAGVDFISFGALTHSVKGLDMSFKATE